jgi:hypothetical protein
LVGSPSPAENFTTTVTITSLAGRSAVLSYLYNDGFSVKAPSGAIVWLVTGTVTSFEKAFNTRLAEYSSASGAPTIAFTTVPSVPSSVPIVAMVPPGDSGVMVPTMGPHGPARSTNVDGRSCPQNYSGTYNPSEIQTAYDISPVLARGLEGQGETIGIIDAYDSATPAPVVAEDLANFDSCYNLPAANLTIAYPVPGGNLNNTYSSGWGLETALDTEWSHATAPLANMTLVMSPNSAYGLYFGLDWLVASRSVDVVSISWGEPEFGLYNGFSGPCSYQCNASSDGSMATLGPVIAQAASEGIDVFAASGDCGANGGTGVFTPWYPASDPHAIGVGGTVLTMNSTYAYTFESGWNGSEQYCWFNGGGSGGGFSSLPRTPWQAGIGVDSFTNTTRGVPDVSLVAADPLGIVYNGSTDYVEGTSDAAPQWAGMGAIIGSAKGGGPPGYLAPTFYQIMNSADYTSDFHPVVVGNNGYAAGFGWNPVTGIGTPNFSNLLSTVLNHTVSIAGTGQMLLNASPLAGTTQYPWDPLPVNVSATPWNGTTTPVRYQFYIGDVGRPYQEANSTTTGVPWAHLNYTRTGSFVVFAAGYNPAGGTTMSNPLVINVGNGGPLQASLSATPSGATADEPVTLQAAAAGGEGPYHFAYFFGDGTYESDWAQNGSSISHAYSRNGSYLVTVVANDSSTPMRGGLATICLTVGTVIGTCPALPKVPVVSVEPVNTTLTAGQSTPVNVQVSYNGQPVNGATVSFSSNQGAVYPATGTTNSTGGFKTAFFSAQVGQTAQFAVFANVTLPGFAKGLGEVLMVVNPVSGPSLVAVVNLAQKVIASGASDSLLIATQVAIDGAIVPGATVKFNSTMGTFYPSVGQVGVDGRIVTELAVPQVDSNVSGQLGVSVSDVGYTTGTATLPFTVTSSYPGVRVVVSTNYTTLPSMASTAVQLSMEDTSGDVSHVPVGSIVPSIQAGMLSMWAKVAPELFDVEYSTPITSSNITEAVAFNVTENNSPTGLAGSGITLITVTWGHGPAVANLITNPEHVLPNTTAKFIARLTSASGGFPLADAFVQIQTAGQGGRIQNYAGWTNALGEYGTNYSAGKVGGVVKVWVNSTAFVYSVPNTIFTVNVTFVPPNQPSIASYVPTVAVVLVGFALAATLVVLEIRRSKRPPEPGKPVPAVGDAPAKH